MQCPRCGSYNLRVVLTKRDQIGCNVRRRCCQQCEHRFYTVERLLHPSEKLSYDTLTQSYVRTNPGVIQESRMRKYVVRVLQNAIETLQKQPEGD